MVLLQSLERPEEWSWGFPEEEILLVNSSLPVPHAQEFQPALPDLLPYGCRTCLAGPFNHEKADSCNKSLLSYWLCFSGRTLTDTIYF